MKVKESFLLTADLVFVLIFLVLSALVDGNGRLPGLDELPSMIAAGALFVLGTLCAVALAVVGKGVARLIAIGSLASYVAMTLPAFI